MGIVHRRSLLLFVVLAVFAVPVVPAAAKTSIKEEIEIGKKAAKDIEKQYPVTENKAWLDEIDRLGKMLTTNVNRKEIPYTFRILKEQNKGKNEIDAFSLPGGPVYFSERMWRILSRDERVGVLAHEIAHVDKRHAIDTMSEAQKRSIFTTAVLIIAGAKGSWWDASDVANQLYTLKYSRKREKEADLTGVQLCVAAKQNPVGLVTSMKKILRLEKENGGTPPRILSTHPATQDRIEYLTARVTELGAKPADLEPKFTDTPDRMGNVLEKGKKGLVTVSTSKPLEANQSIYVKKPLWDDRANSMMPTTVAVGTVKTAGAKSEVELKMEPGFEYEDVEQGDGVYPVPVPAPPAK